MKPLPVVRDDDQGPETFERHEEYQTSKLVYGMAREGSADLLAHRSHSSHSSHRSHSSHSSHYSGAGAPAPSVPIVTPTPRPAPAPSPITPKAPLVAPKITPPAPKTTNAVAATAGSLLDQVLKKLPKVRSKWPREVQLVKTTQFTMRDGGKEIGVMTLNPGTKVNLVEVKPEHAVILMAGSMSPVPVQNTDLIDRMGGLDAVLRLVDESEIKVEAESPKQK